MRKLLPLVGLTLLVSLPVLAADQSPAVPMTKGAAVSAPVESNDTPSCGATQPEDAAATPLLFEAPAAQPESCFPAECGSSAPPGCPTSPGCCKLKCCIC